MKLFISDDHASHLLPILQIMRKWTRFLRLCLRFIFFSSLAFTFAVNRHVSTPNGKKENWQRTISWQRLFSQSKLNIGELARTLESLGFYQHDNWQTAKSHYTDSFFAAKYSPWAKHHISLALVWILGPSQTCGSRAWILAKPADDACAQCTSMEKH